MTKKFCDFCGVGVSTEEGAGYHIRYYVGWEENVVELCYACFRDMKDLIDSKRFERKED